MLVKVSTKAHQLIYKESNMTRIIVDCESMPHTGKTSRMLSVEHDSKSMMIVVADEDHADEIKKHPDFNPFVHSIITIVTLNQVLFENSRYHNCNLFDKLVFVSITARNAEKSLNSHINTLNNFVFLFDEYDTYPLDCTLPILPNSWYNTTKGIVDSDRTNVLLNGSTSPRARDQELICVSHSNDKIAPIGKTVVAIEGRQSGKTTRLIAQALRVASVGYPVVIVAAQHKMGEYLRYMLESFPIYNSTLCDVKIIAASQVNKTKMQLDKEVNWFFDEFEFFQDSHDVEFIKGAYYTSTLGFDNQLSADINELLSNDVLDMLSNSTEPQFEYTNSMNRNHEAIYAHVCGLTAAFKQQHIAYESTQEELKLAKEQIAHLKVKLAKPIKVSLEFEIDPSTIEE